LVIDPFNKVRSNDASGDVNVYTLEYLQKIEIFAKKYDVLVIVVAHPTKMYKDANGKIEEPTMYNIKGGGEWYDASYHGLLFIEIMKTKPLKLKCLRLSFKT
jgi:twinkle protein